MMAEKKKKSENISKKFKRFFTETFKVNDKNNENKKQSNFEIVKGSRKKKLIVRIVCYSLILAVIITVLVINATTPTGLIEKIQNDYAAKGNGEFPVNVYAQNADNMVSNGDVALILNNTYLEVYNDNGKLINAFSHGMFNPSIKCSEARFLVFDRNRYSVKIYNYSTELLNKTFDKNVTCADIGRNGTYAVVTTSDTHNNTVSVFNKNNEPVYSWNSANGYITDVVVADNGKSVAVCLVDAKDGTYVSSVYVLRYDSASPYYKVEYDTIITSISAVNKSYFLVNGVDFAAVIEWEGSNREIDFSGVIRHFGVNFKGISAIVCGREDNEQSNSIIIIGEDGSVLSKFDFNSPVSDFSINTGYVMLLSGNSAFVFDHSGNLINEFVSDTKPNFGYITKNGNVMVLDNSLLKSLTSKNQE